MKVQYLTEKQVSEITGRALQTLRNERFLGRGIPYVKVGRSIRYSLEDVVGFMESRKIGTEDSMCMRQGSGRHARLAAPAFEHFPPLNGGMGPPLGKSERLGANP